MFTAFLRINCKINWIIRRARIALELPEATDWTVSSLSHFGNYFGTRMTCCFVKTSSGSRLESRLFTNKLWFKSLTKSVSLVAPSETLSGCEKLN